MGTVIRWKTGTETNILELECEEKVSYESTAEVTEKSVERGVNITDHVRANNSTFTIEAFVSNNPTRPPLGTSYTISTKTVDLNGTKGTVLQWDQSFDRARSVDSELDGLISRGELLTITTNLRELRDVVLTRYHCERDVATANGLPVILEGKAIRIVDSRVVSVPVPRDRRGQTQQNRGGQTTTEVPNPSPRRSVLAQFVSFLGGN